MLLWPPELHLYWISFGSRAMFRALTESRASRELQAKEFQQVPSKVEPLLPSLVPLPTGTRQPAGDKAQILLAPAPGCTRYVEATSLRWRVFRPDDSSWPCQHCLAKARRPLGRREQALRRWAALRHPEHPAVPSTCTPFGTQLFAPGAGCWPGLGGPVTCDLCHLHCTLAAPLGFREVRSHT